MTDDLIEQLRCYPANRLCRQVADALEAKDARIAALEAALKPLALQNLSTEVQMVTAVYLTPIGELDRQAREIKRRDDEIRAARAALGEKNDNE